MPLRHGAEPAIHAGPAGLARNTVRAGHGPVVARALTVRGVAQPVAVADAVDGGWTGGVALRAPEASRAHARAARLHGAGLAQRRAGDAAVVREAPAREVVAQVLAEAAAAADGLAVVGEGQHRLHGLAVGAVRQAAVDAVEVEELVLSRAQAAAATQAPAVDDVVAEGLQRALQVEVPVVGARGVILQRVRGVGQRVEVVVSLVPLGFGPGQVCLHLECGVRHLVQRGLPFTLVKAPDTGQGGRVLGDVGPGPEGSKDKT